MASAHLLPGLSAAALIETINGQQGWSDIRKMAGKHYSAATQPLDGEEPSALAEAILKDRANMIRVLDEYIDTLTSLRKDIVEENKQELQDRLDKARRERGQWQLERAKGDWLAIETGRQEMPKISGILRQQIGGLDKIFKRRDKKPDGD